MPGRRRSRRAVEGRPSSASSTTPACVRRAVAVADPRRRRHRQPGLGAVRRRPATRPRRPNHQTLPSLVLGVLVDDRGLAVGSVRASPRWSATPCDLVVLVRDGVTVDRRRAVGAGDVVASRSRPARAAATGCRRRSTKSAGSGDGVGITSSSTPEGGLGSDAPPHPAGRRAASARRRARRTGARSPRHRPHRRARRPALLASSRASPRRTVEESS